MLFLALFNVSISSVLLHMKNLASLVYFMTEKSDGSMQTLCSVPFL